MGLIHDRLFTGYRNHWRYRMAKDKKQVKSLKKKIAEQFEKVRNTPKPKIKGTLKDFTKNFK